MTPVVIVGWIPPSEVGRVPSVASPSAAGFIFSGATLESVCVGGSALVKQHSPTSDGGMEASTTVSVLRRTAVGFSSSVSHHLKLAKFQAPRRRRRRVDVDVGSADLDFGRPRHSHFFCQYSILISAYSPPTSHSARGRGISRRHGSHEPAEGSAGRGAIQAPAGAADVTSPTNLTTRASRKPPTEKTTTQHFRTPFP